MASRAYGGVVSGQNECPDSVWIGAGTWLVDRLHGSIGVVTEVQNRDSELDAGLAIRWRTPQSYQNIAVRAALSKFRRGRWKIDNVS